MSSRAARIGRGSVAALVSTFVAALSHVVAGGGGPGVIGLTLALTFSTLACIALAGRRLSTPRLSLAVILSQLMFHTLFTVGGAISTPSGLTGMSGMAGMNHGALSGPLTTATTTLPTAGGALAATDSAPTFFSWMLLAHVLAAVATIAMLRRGEKTFWSLASWAKLRIRAVAHAGIPTLAPLPAFRQTAVGSEPAHLADLGSIRRSIRRRGPPAFLPAF